MAHTNDHTRLPEAQINRAAPSALPIADAAYHVIGLFRERVDRADIIGMMDWETAIVKHVSHYWQGETLGQFDNLPFGVRIANVNPTDQQWIFGVEQGVKDGAQHALLRESPHDRCCTGLDGGFHSRGIQRLATIGHIDWRRG